MLATMRPNLAHPTPSSTSHSRPDSRASSHGSSPVTTPSKSKAERSRQRSVANGSNGGPGKKASAQRRQANQHPLADSSEDFLKVSPEDLAAVTSAQTPGLLSLSKPLSEYDSDRNPPSSQAKGKKTRSEAAKKTDGQGRNRQQRSASPSADGVAGKAQAAPKQSNRGSSRKAGKTTGDKRNATLDLLSKSAPSGTLGHLKPGSRDAAAAADVTGEDSGSGLTWQQELLRSSSGPGSRSSADVRKSGNKRNSSLATKHDGVLAQPQIQHNDAASLTWQQELLGAGKRRAGPKYDVFADARDAETFGGSGAASHEAKGRRRARAGSVGSGATKGQKGSNRSKAGADVPLQIDDLFNSAYDSSAASSGHQHRRGPSSNSFAQDAQPATPAKKQGLASGQQQHPSVAAAIAYAGPNFHNSPSPASLPAPKFTSRSTKIELGNGQVPGSSLGASSSSSSASSDDEYESRRGERSATAPAEMHTPSKAAVQDHNYPAAVEAAQAAPAAAPKNSEPDATVESLLARMMGGVKFAM